MLGIYQKHITGEAPNVTINSTNLSLLVSNTLNNESAQITTMNYVHIYYILRMTHGWMVNWMTTVL